ncbi:formate dehydrogenase [Pandoraea terrae]|uniref:Formate dehydrogenase n=1 Tax=Pandoraea terrae TaxID=1537710 RepID=A0A5E4SG09_9BURK|nr:formate dehydrogenase subunit delta [Pandoraea terrae]VVD73098.1 formate dehydrogenase [Pandoraea terrae]
MDGHNLVRMANSIGDFFGSMPDHDEAVGEVAGHLHKFWDPRMRTQILDMLGTPAEAEMHQLVREALQQHRARLTPHA